ncbi:putative neurexin [Fasciola gigantica]|uniref:Putative neurexin n=1 Tax=Fasciola gigantica TaxID=46835 RepID=A0A504Z218_FASGI|nr:putative neurexin [Fasciola gigantica]
MSLPARYFLITWIILGTQCVCFRNDSTDKCHRVRLKPISWSAGFLPSSLMSSRMGAYRVKSNLLRNVQNTVKKHLRIEDGVQPLPVKIKCLYVEPVLNCPMCKTACSNWEYEWLSGLMTTSENHLNVQGATQQNVASFPLAGQCHCETSSRKVPDKVVVKYLMILFTKRRVYWVSMPRELASSFHLPALKDWKQHSSSLMCSVLLCFSKTKMFKRGSSFKGTIGKIAAPYWLPRQSAEQPKAAVINLNSLLRELDNENWNCTVKSKNNIFYGNNHKSNKLTEQTSVFRSRASKPYGTQGRELRFTDEYNANTPHPLPSRNGILDSHSSFSTLSRYARGAGFVHEPRELKGPIFSSITFRNSDAYLAVPALRLYGYFTLRFLIRTVQSDGLILFNPGSFAVDFIAFEISQGQIYINFDMGSGVQRHGLVGTHVDDNRWHIVELIRSKDMEVNVLTLCMDLGSGTQSRLDIKVLHGERSKNFNFAEPLYIGGIPKSVVLKWREKLHIVHGFQGCLANFSVNNQPVRDLMKEATDMSFTRTPSKYSSTEDVVTGCTDRPLGAPQCPARTYSQGLYEAGPNANLSKGSNEEYCMNDGICLLMWSTLKCSCELTSFQGSRCSKPGTTQRFGIRVPFKRSATYPFLAINADSRSNASLANVGYLKLTYTDFVRNTRQEEFVLGIQTTARDSEAYKSSSQKKSRAIETLLFVTGSAQTGDFLHVYLQSGFVHLDCDFGGSLIRVIIHQIRVNDGFYHRIRGFRRDYRLILEVDQLRSTHQFKGPYGKQFNDQETIWLGHAPSLNRTDFFHGYMSGVYYNGLQLSEISAGLIYLPFIHVTRYANVEYIENFEAALSPTSPFRSHKDQLQVEFQKDSNRSVSETDFEALQVTKDVSNAHLDTESVQHNGLVPLIARSENLLSSEENLHHNSFDTSSERSDVQGSIYDQVNIWLLVCLSGAGFVMLASVTFLAYRFHLRQFSCWQSNRSIQRQHKASPSRPCERYNVTADSSNFAFQTVLSCSPALLPSSYSGFPKASLCQMNRSTTEACNRTVALMLSKPSPTDNGDKIGQLCSSSCFPVRIQDEPTSVVYIDKNDLVSTTRYEPWEHYPISTRDHLSSVSPYSTNSSPVTDVKKSKLKIMHNDEIDK